MFGRMGEVRGEAVFLGCWEGQSGFWTGFGVMLTGLIYCTYLFYMMSGEDSLTTSETSSYLWECFTQGSSDRVELSAQLSLPPPSWSPPASSEPRTSLISMQRQPLQQRSEHQIRSRYFQGLQRHGLLPQRPKKKIHHLIVFDWDDTLFCTSFMQGLLQGEWQRAGEWEKQKTEDIDKVASSLLELAVGLGEVAIVTNSVEGWVDYCSQNFMPLTHAVIVISARDRFQPEFPGDSQKWKAEAFSGLIAEYEGDIIMNLLSVGDSTYEIDAAEQSTRRFQKRFVKTIKLRQKPRGQQLLKQLKLVASRIAQLFSAPKTLTIKLQPKQ